MDSHILTSSSLCNPTSKGYQELTLFRPHFVPGYHLAYVLTGAPLTQAIVGPGHIRRAKVQTQRQEGDPGGPPAGSSCWLTGPPSCYRNLGAEVLESLGAWFLLNSTPGLMKAVFFLQPLLTDHARAL